MNGLGCVTHSIELHWSLSIKVRWILRIKVLWIFIVHIYSPTFYCKLMSMHCESNNSVSNFLFDQNMLASWWELTNVDWWIQQNPMLYGNLIKIITVYAYSNHPPCWQSLWRTWLSQLTGYWDNIVSANQPTKCIRSVGFYAELCQFSYCL